MEPVWFELWDPLDSLISLDMAFAITGTPFVEDSLDWGDAPDPYPTLSASNGANHFLDGATYLGACVDAEPDGQPNTDATGDDLDILYPPSNDDEDGVIFDGSFVKGFLTPITIEASIDGFLNAWIDFNGDGNWVGEQIFTNLPLAAGFNGLSINVPTGAASGFTYARFRFTGYSVGTPLPTGQETDGEVEDYKVFINEPIDNIKMGNPQYPDPDGWDVDMSIPRVLADDWMCNETGTVSDVHFWISCPGDSVLPYIIDPPFGISGIRLSIHSDLPADDPTNPYGYSMPDSLLWEAAFEYPEYTISPEPYFESLQGWYDPMEDIVLPDDHYLCFRVDIPIVYDPYIQIEGTIYWLDIFVEMINPEWHLGWKTSIDHWNDNAVWGFFLEPMWFDLWDPIDSLIPLDMAFAITGYPIVDSLDFGDAPSSYPTLLPTGARHTINPAIYLGTSIDAELDGQPTVNADGDDINGIDDEDGVVFTCPLYRGHQGAVTVTNSVPGYLNTWIDFNGDGSWVQADEHIYNDLYLNIAGNHPLTFPIPPGAGLGTTYARFRFSTVTGLSYDGLADDGEVEDYKVIIEETELQTKMHFIQWPDTTTCGMDIYAVQPGFLADDFLCMESGNITEIHIWCSWKNDMWPDIPPAFLLMFWSDDPVGPGYSQPDSLLWDGFYSPGEYQAFIYQIVEQEWWYNPFVYELNPAGDTVIWEYIFYVNEEPFFFQEEGNIYWLSVQAILEMGIEEFGWKTSTNHWNDDAVRGEPARMLNWYELYYPDTHPLHPYSIDMAFYGYGQLGTPGDITITVYEDSSFVKIEWTTVPGATSYKVYSSTDPYAAFPSGWTLEGTTPNLYFDDGPPIPTGRKRFYKVVAQ